MVSSTDGWPTNTCWKRRSSAASVSMYLRYSSSVVAPIMRSSPRASIGLIMLPASIAPSALPAPTIVWSSSMKVMTSPSASVISLRTAFSRSSNSPRYLAPATMLPRSRLMRRLSFRPSGTSPSTMRRARPSTMAVLPTPGSPISTGLFFVRRESTWMTAADLLVAPDDRVELPAAGRLGEVAAVLLERLVLVLGGLAGDAVAAPDLAQRGEQVLAGDAELVGQREQQVLGGEVLVGELDPGRVGPVHHGLEVARDARLAAVGLGELVEPLERRVAQLRRCAARPSRAPGARRPRPGRAGRRGGGRGAPRGCSAVRAASTAALKASWVRRVQRFGSSAMPPG